MKILATSVHSILLLSIWNYAFGKKDTNETTKHRSVNTFQINAKDGYYNSYNSEKQKVALLDYHNNISILYDGLTGDAFGVSYEDGRCVYLPGESSKQTWNIKDKSYDEYFKNPIPPQEIFSIGIKKGYHFDPELISKDIAQKMSAILYSLSLDYSSQCEALPTLLYISKITADNLKTSLSGFEDIVSSVRSENRGDLKSLVGVGQGMGDFFAPFGSTEALKEKKIKLDLEKIISKEPTGFHVLCYFLEELADHFDLGKALNHTLNSQVEFFKLISKLGGDVNHGFDGLIYIIAEMLKYNIEENSKQNLEAVLKFFFTSPQANVDNLGQKWRTSINDVQQTLKTLKLEKDFSQLMKYLQDIQDGKWYHRKVNMSEVVECIMGVSLPATDNVVPKIIEKLQKREN